MIIYQECESVEALEKCIELAISAKDWDHVNELRRRQKLARRAERETAAGLKQSYTNIATIVGE